MQDLTRNEELILLSIWRLREGAYGISIRKNIKEITERMIHYGSLYNTLYILQKKGLVAITKTEPESKKGGRSKVLYYLTKEGKKALNSSQKLQQLAWEGIGDFAYDED